MSTRVEEVHPHSFIMRPNQCMLCSAKDPFEVTSKFNDLFGYQLCQTCLAGNSGVAAANVRNAFSDCILEDALGRTHDNVNVLRSNGQVEGGWQLGTDLDARVFKPRNAAVAVLSETEGVMILVKKSGLFKYTRYTDLTRINAGWKAWYCREQDPDLDGAHATVWQSALPVGSV